MVNSLTKRTPPILLVAGFCALGLLFAACSGDDDANGEDGSRESDATPLSISSDIDVCSLVSRQEAAEAIGLPVNDGLPGTGVGGETGLFFTCGWAIEGLEGLGALSVQILTVSQEARDHYYELSAGEEIDGLGRRAQYDDFVGLQVMTDDLFIGLNMVQYDLTDEERRVRLLAFAELLLDRLS